MFEEFSNIEIFTMAFTFIGVLVIGAAKYYERKVNSGESWSDAKFGMFFVVVTLVMLFEYAYSGSVNFPAEEVISAFMTLLQPIFVVFGTAYSALIAGSLFKKTVVLPTIASVATPEPIPEVPKPEYKKMTDSTKRWLTFDATPENKAKILAQIEESEKQELYTYQIHFNGGYYVIVGGILNGGAGNPSGDI